MFPSFFHNHEDVLSCLDSRIDVYPSPEEYATYLKTHSSFLKFVAATYSKLGYCENAHDIIDRAMSDEDSDAYCQLCILVNYYFVP